MVPPIDPSILANNVALTSKYSQVVNHGAVASTARTGAAPIFWIGTVDPTNATNNDSLYRSDLTAMFVRVVGTWVEVGSGRYALAASVIPTAWTPVTFINSWSGGAGNPLSYRKIGDIVHLRGAAQGGAAASNVCYLPVGHRPAVTVILSMLVQGGLLGYTRIYPSGNLEHNGANSGSTEWSTYFSTV